MNGTLRLCMFHDEGKFAKERGVTITFLDCDDFLASIVLQASMTSEFHI